MKENQNVAIVLLLVTAGILTALVVVSFPTSEAVADTSIRRGDYIMCAGEWSASTDLIYIIDIAAKRLNAYFTNRNTKSIQRIDTVDLAKAFR